MKKKRGFDRTEKMNELLSQDNENGDGKVYISEDHRWR